MRTELEYELESVGRNKTVEKKPRSSENLKARRAQETGLGSIGSRWAARPENSFDVVMRDAEDSCSSEEGKLSAEGLRSQSWRSGGC